MKVISKKTFRKKSLLVLVPMVFMLILLVATSGQVAVGAHYVPAYNVPPPGPFPPAPKAFADNDSDGNPNYTGYVSVAELVGPSYLGTPGNQGTVHIIDVRSSFEYLADVCPMQIALGMPTYPTTNVGHPVWNWAAPSGPATVDAQYEEAYSASYWIGFYFAGYPGVAENIRMEENPDFHSYIGALVGSGAIGAGDKLVILCQTGYRASFAAMEINQMDVYGMLPGDVPGPGFFSEVVVLYGGMLAWSDDWSLDDTDPLDLDGDSNFDPDMDINCDANDPTDPSPDDDPANPSTPPYITPVPWTNNPTWKDCDPDNTPGPLALNKSSVLTAPWKYDPTLIGPTQMVDYFWNGTEPHVAVKPWWMSGMGANDSWLALSVDGVDWGNWTNFTNMELPVTYRITNNPPMNVTPSPWGGLPFPWNMNYGAACGSAPDYGGGSPGTCEPVGQAAHGNAYNTMIVASTSTNPGVTVAAGLPGMMGTIAPNASATATLTYALPTNATGFTFNATVYAMSTDVVDPTDTYPAGFNDAFHTPLMCTAFGSCGWDPPMTGMGWYGVYMYPGPPPGP